MNGRIPAALAATGLLILGVAGCDPPPEIPPDAQVTYDTINGVVHVVSGDRGAWVRGGSWHVDPNGLLIGVADGAEDYTFGQIAGLVVNADGRIYVGDSQAGEVRVFDAHGSFVGRFGRPGAGPGEFRNISGLTRAPDGVAVLDGRLGRVTVFRPDGGVVRTFRLERPYMLLEQGAVMRFDERGRFYDRTPLDPSPQVDDIAVLIYGPDGQPVDAVRVASVERDQLVIQRDGVPVMGMLRPFTPTPSLAVGRDGTIFFSRGDQYRITVLSPEGDTLRVLRRRVRPRPVTEEERDSALTRIAGMYRQAGVAPPARIDLPETKPVIAQLHVDETGYLWVGRFGDISWSHMEWGIHAPDGRYLGALATPVMRVMHVGAGEVAGVVTDELGVQRVGVFSIRR